MDSSVDLSAGCSTSAVLGMQTGVPYSTYTGLTGYLLIYGIQHTVEHNLRCTISK